MAKNKKTIYSKDDLACGIHVSFHWTVSRGADTYGYNICSIYVNGEKQNHCMGGGYDMQGTALAGWIEYQFQEELKTLEAHHYKKNHDENDRGTGFYGLRFIRPNTKYASIGKWEQGDKISVDGGCGFSCMQTLLGALGYQLRWLPSRKKDDSHYMLEPLSD